MITVVNNEWFLCCDTMYNYLKFAFMTFNGYNCWKLGQEGCSKNMTFNIKFVTNLTFWPPWMKYKIRKIQITANRRTNLTFLRILLLTTRLMRILFRLWLILKLFFFVCLSLTRKEIQLQYLNINFSKHHAPNPVSVDAMP